MDETKSCLSTLVLTGFIAFICTPIIICGIIRFTRHKREIPIKLRDPCMTIFIVSLLLIRIIGQTSINSFKCVGYDINILFTEIILPPLSWIPCCLIALRFRMMHERINCIFDISTLAWKNILTNNAFDSTSPWEKESQNENNIFIKYILYGLLGCVIQIIKTVLFYHTNIINGELLTIILLIPLVLNILYMNCGYASPMIRDIYFVKWEESFIAIFCSFYIISFGVLHILSLKYQDLHSLFQFIQLSCTNISLILVCIIMTIGLCIKIHKIIYRKRKNLNPKRRGRSNTSRFDEFVFIESNITLSSIHTKRDKSPQPKVDKKTIFKLILNDNDGIQLYCEHLFSEYTIENIVSFIELNQWLNEYSNETGTNAEDMDDARLSGILVSLKKTKKDEAKLEFCDEVPLSYINNNTEYGWFDKIKALYKKYIAQYCELQINIPYSVRMRFEALMDLYQFRIDNPMPTTIHDTIQEFEPDFVLDGYDSGVFDTLSPLTQQKSPMVTLRSPLAPTVRSSQQGTMRSQQGSIQYPWSQRSSQRNTMTSQQGTLRSRQDTMTSGQDTFKSQLTSIKSPMAMGTNRSLIHVDYAIPKSKSAGYAEYNMDLAKQSKRIEFTRFDPTTAVNEPSMSFENETNKISVELSTPMNKKQSNNNKQNI